MTPRARRVAGCLLAAVACAGPNVLAQASPDVIPAAKQEVLTLREKSLFPYSDGFPAEAEAQRLSGEVIVLADVLASGKWANARVEVSSGSTVLDGAALEVAAHLEGKPREADAAPVPVRIPIGFSLDSLQTVSTKTCEEFNRDLAQYRTLKPGAKAADMRVFDLVSGVWVSLKGAMTLEAVKRLPAAPDKVADACAKRPRAKFMDTFMDAMR